MIPSCQNPRKRRNPTIPYYNFACGQCGQRFEIKVAVDERDKVVCPACGAARPRQLLSNVGIIRKASGGDRSASADRSCESCDQRFG